MSRKRGTWRVQNWVDAHGRWRICGGPANLMGDPRTPSELDRDEFEGRERNPLRHLFPPRWHCSALHSCWGQCLPLCQRRWKAQVVSDRLPGCMGSSWRYLFVSSSTCISEEGFLWLEGRRGRGRKQTRMSKGIEIMCFLLSALGFHLEVHSWISESIPLVDLPVRSWAPPKAPSAKPTLPSFFCALLSAALRTNPGKKKIKNLSYSIIFWNTKEDF